MTQGDAGLLALVERAMEEWENDQEAPGTESCAQHIVAALRASPPPPEAGVREALDDFANRCQAYLDDAPGSGGHSDAAGSNAYELVQEAIDHVRPLALRSSPPPTAGREATGWLIERGETKPEMILYFRFEPLNQHWSWTADNLTASRFGRKIDAELAWCSMTKHELSEVDIIEHMWCDPAISPCKCGATCQDLGPQGGCRYASPLVSDASLSFVCPKCGTRGITDGNASTVSDASREALAKALRAVRVVLICRGVQSDSRIIGTIDTALAKSFDNPGAPHGK